MCKIKACKRICAWSKWKYKALRHVKSIDCKYFKVCKTQSSYVETYIKHVKT